jgi:3-deoxy-D-manno-octulosonate 8-phosphate phosphatase (KDO 8-P phosphatase)
MSGEIINNPNNILEAFRRIKAFIFDMDGVLTNGQLLVTESGEYYRQSNMKDGYAIQLAVQKGLYVILISGAQSKGMQQRLQNLGVQYIHMGIHNKLACLNACVQQYQLSMDEILYMGDDMPDLPCLQAVGVATCPQDAADDIRAVADYISPYAGGKGCVRDVIEKVLKLKGLWT